MQARADVIVIGGAIMGASTAMHLAAAAPGLAVLVIEQDPSFRLASTTRSAGGIRQQFSTPECIAMSQATMAMVRAFAASGQMPLQDLSSWRRDAGPTSAAAALGFHEQGYLLLASEAGQATLARNVDLQRRHGADTHLLRPDDLARRFDWLALAGVAAAGFGAAGEGWLDGALLLQAFKAEARSLGAVFATGRVVDLERQGDRITGVVLGDGRRLACGSLVNAAGPAAGTLARMAGVDLPVEPRKRFVFAFDGREVPPDLRRAPLTIDPSGVWFRPEGRRFICGVSPRDDAEEPDPCDLDALDHAVFDDHIWPVLAVRVPAFSAIKVTGAWAGHYDYNTLDQNAVIGAHDQVANLYFCNGFSGHGLQHAYAAGRAVAELIVHGRFVTLDLSRLGYARIRLRQPLIEANII